MRNWDSFYYAAASKTWASWGVMESAAATAAGRASSPLLCHSRARLRCTMLRLSVLIRLKNLQCARVVDEKPGFAATLTKNPGFYYAAASKA